jgi:hypothetical protein
MLAAEIPVAAAIARFMRERLGRHNVLTPAVSDMENMPPLLYTYLNACLVADVGCREPLPPLPCEALDGMRRFPDSGITAVGTPHYYAVINPTKGGVCRVFDKQTGKIAYEDAGYLVRAGGRTWTSQRIGLGRSVETSRTNEVASMTPLAEVRQELPTAAKFILLRMLNLTLFRNLALGNWVRRLIVRRLITAKRPGPLRLNRSVTFGRDSIRFQDRLEAARFVQVEDVALPRSFTAIHMGSAKYFHPSELEAPPQVPVGAMARDLNGSRAARCEFTLHFSATTGPELVVGLAVAGTEPAHAETPT